MHYPWSDGDDDDDGEEEDYYYYHHHHVEHPITMCYVPKVGRRMKGWFGPTTAESTQMLLVYYNYSSSSSASSQQHLGPTITEQAVG